MSFIKLRVKVLSPFKDGNILEGRELKVDEVLTLSEDEVNKILQSGGELEVMDKVIPNPKKSEPVEGSDEVVAGKKNAKNKN